VKAPLAVCARAGAADAHATTATHTVRVLDIGSPLNRSDSRPFATLRRGGPTPVLSELEGCPLRADT
jgi:hypothetical protein